MRNGVFKYFDRQALLGWRDTCTAHNQPFRNPLDRLQILTTEMCVVDVDAKAAVEGRLVELRGELPPSWQEALRAAAVWYPTSLPVLPAPAVQAPVDAPV